MSNRKISLRSALFLGAASLSLATAAQADQTMETVVITGSHIASPNLQSSAPVLEATALDIAVMGTTKVEDLLNQMPQIFAGQNATVSNGATGTSEVNMLGLGCTRNLVLIDGRRMPYGSALDTCADLNQIPTQLVDRVDVLVGGASAVYGSDAVSGVVNFIMKKDFEGFQLDMQYGVYEHDNANDAPGNIRNVITGRAATNPAQFKLPSDQVWTGAGKQLSAMMGVSSANGKGNITAYFSYRQNDAILQAKYDYSACSLGAPTAAGHWTCGGSSTSYPGRFTDFSTLPWAGPQDAPAPLSMMGSDPACYDNGNPTTGNSICASNYTINASTGNTFRRFKAATDQYNYGPLNFYQRPDERYSAGAFGHYQIAPFAEVYTQIMYTDYVTNAQIAPSGDFGNTATVNCNNPLLSTQQYNLLCGGYVLDSNNVMHGPYADRVLGPTGVAPFYILRRNIEGGGRNSHLSNTSFRAVLGFKGQIDDAWSYDISGTYSKVMSEQIYQHDFSATRLARALDVVSVGGVPTCQSVVDGTDRNCVPYNIFSIGGVTQAAINYLQVPLMQTGYTKQTAFDFGLTGDLSKYGVVSPFAKNGVSLFLGADWRQDELSTTTDTEFSTGDGAGQGGPTIGLSGASHVAEGFLEAQVPVIEDAPFAKSVSLDLTYRYSAYDRATANTWGVSSTWAMMDDFSLRGSFERAVRAANVVEMFLAQGLNLTSSITNDPCGPNHAIGGYTATQADCAMTPGAGAASWYGSAGLDSPAGQYNFLQGGNPNLKPEKAETYTLGFIYTPTYLTGLNVTVDYYSVALNNAISNIDPHNVLYACYALHNAGQCANIHRTAGGLLWLGGGFISALNTNIGGVKTSGVNYNVSYQTDLADVGLDGAGVLGLTINGNYLNRLTTNSGVGTSDACVGWYSSSCGTPNPKWRQTTRVTWEAPWYDITVVGTWRFYGGVKQYNGNTARIDYHWPSRSYFDLSASAPVFTGTNLRLGVNNIFDNDPPLSWTVGTAGNGNTYPQVYDSMGRYLFAELQINM